MASVGLGALGAFRRRLHEADRQSLNIAALVSLPALLLGLAAAFLPTYAQLIILAAVLVVPLALLKPEAILVGAIFLVSSDKFLIVEVGRLTLKPSHVLFVLALAGALARSTKPGGRALFQELPGLVTVSFCGLLTIHVVSSLLSPRPRLGLINLAVPVVGALIPMAAVLKTLPSKKLVERGLSAFVLAQLTVALFGIYQFIATYAGLPLALPSLGAINGVSRVSALSYEPAFYGAYVVTGLPLLILDFLRRTKRSVVPPGVILSFVLVAFLLTISRAGIVALPLIVTGVWVIHADKKPLAILRLAVTVAAALTIVFALGRSIGYDPTQVVRQRSATILDTREPTSNAPRLVLYRAVGQLIRENPKWGVGPGGLGYALPSYGIHFRPGDEHTATANNIWLQAAAENGVAAIPLVGGLLVGLIWIGRKSDHIVKALVLGAAVFLLVNGALVSFLWDTKLWVVVGLALAARAVDGSASGRNGPSAPDLRHVGSLADVSSCGPGGKTSGRREALGC